MYVDDLGVVGASYVDEGVELEADGSFEGSKHSICKWVIEGDDILGVVGGGVSFLVGYDVCAVWCRLKSGGCEGEVVVNELDGCEVCLG